VAVAGVESDSTVSEVAMFPVVVEGPVVLELTLVPFLPNRAGGSAHFKLEVHNRSERIVMAPTDLSDHSGGGVLALFDESGKWIECAHAWPIMLADGTDDSGCWTHELDLETQSIDPQSSMDINFKTSVRHLEPGTYGAEFWYAAREVGRPAGCPALSPNGLLYGPQASQRIEFRLQ